MKFLELVKALKYSDLSAHGIFVTPELTEENKEKLLFATNQALTDIYTRFPLLEKNLTLIQQNGKTTYPLHKEYAFTQDPKGNNWFIFDSKFEPFTGDVIKITGVVDEAGEEYRPNAIEQYCKAYFTSSPDTIELVDIEPENALFVSYRARHPEVTIASDIIIPSNWYPALYALIAHKVYAGGTSQEHVMKSQEMLQKFEMFCTQQRDYGMANEDMFSECHFMFEKGGWV